MIMAVDRDGLGNAYSSAQVAQINNVSGLNVQTLLDDGNLVVS